MGWREALNELAIAYTPDESDKSRKPKQLDDLYTPEVTSPRAAVAPAFEVISGVS